ncbi:MAG: hypothetical protein MJZ11_05310 [Lachnospiraceae bacterium]|nr:hypothetical protein [Lachnospiraceae bacterium]
MIFASTGIMILAVFVLVLIASIFGSQNGRVSRTHERSRMNVSRKSKLGVIVFLLIIIAICVAAYFFFGGRTFQRAIMMAA